MLQFKEIKEDKMDDIKIESIGDDQLSIPKSFILIYTDNELSEESIPEMWEKLNEHDFDGDTENIDFIIYYDNLNEESKIIMALYYPEDANYVTEINKISDQHRSIFENFYKKNIPY